ncbi:MAG: hypothetical protein QNJ46_34340, partial [Leptolyngbyaceae cyanobacterium MO_188.B28]|nr:hypothetical protein [Leptolyngbyaceae cyanobacterium MO_188.B28]
MYSLFQHFRKTVGKIHILWIALFCFGALLLWSQISLGAEPAAGPHSAQPLQYQPLQYPIEIAAQPKFTHLGWT